MGPLTRYGREATSVFDLLGRNEVDLTAALGWCLVKAPSLLQLLLKHLDIPASTDDVDIALEAADALGRTAVAAGDTAVRVTIGVPPSFPSSGPIEIAEQTWNWSVGLGSDGSRVIHKVTAGPHGRRAVAGAIRPGTWPCGERTGPGTKDSSS